VTIPVSQRRPRVLLIPNTSYWILGAMCLHIQRTFADEFEFFILPETLFEAWPQLWDRILPEVDLVHAVNESSAGLLAKLPEIPCPVITWIHHVTRWSADHVAACEISDAIVACTAGWKQSISAHTTKPIYVVRHGVDTSLFAPVPQARKRFGIPEDDFVVGFFGNKGSDLDDSRKGVNTFLEVVKRCGARIPNLHVLLLGPGWNAGEFEMAGIKLTYPGLLPGSELPAAYSALDAYLMTARVEGGPVTVLEAMACGTPVVATRVGLVPDVIRDGENGMSAEPGDVDALCEAMVTLASNRQLRAQLSANARRDVGLLSWPAMLAPLGDLYRDAISSRGARPARDVASPRRGQRSRTFGGGASNAALFTPPGTPRRAHPQGPESYTPSPENRQESPQPPARLAHGGSR